jgi:hypothetical protein
MVSPEMVGRVSFLDSIAFRSIAFVAGSELHLKELRSQIKGISYVTASNSVIVPIVGTFTTLYLANWVPLCSHVTLPIV